MKSKFFTVKTIAGLGILSALVIVLQLLSNYVQFGPVSVNLALFPIAVGAMLYGPIGGLLLGLLDGVLVITAPSTISFFFAVSPVGTIIVCLGKTAVAGLVAGYVFKLAKFNINLEYLAALLILPNLLLASTDRIFESALMSLSWGPALVKIVRFALIAAFVFFIYKGATNPAKSSAVMLTSLTVPLVNTGLFLIAALTVFSKKIAPMADAAGQSMINFLIFAFIGWNFLLEFGLNALLASAFHNTYKSIEGRIHRGR